MSTWLMGVKRPLKVGFVAACLAVVVALLIPNYYKSEAKLLPESNNSMGALGGLASAAAALGVSIPPGGGGKDDNFVDILQSRWLQERLLQSELQFKVKSWRFGAEFEKRQTLYEYLNSKNMDLAIRKLKPMLTINQNLKSKIITFSAESLSPTLSQEIVKNGIRMAEKFIMERGQTRGGAKATFAEARLKEAKNELDSAQAELTRFIVINRNYRWIRPSCPSATPLEGEFKLHQQLVETLAISREQALLEEKNDMPILNVLDGGNLPFEKSRPHRALMVMVTFLFAFGGVLIYQKKSWIINFFIEPEGGSQSV